MRAANRNRHPADPDCKRIAAKRTEVKCFDPDAFVKSKMTKPARVGIAEKRPVDGHDFPSRSER